MKISNLSLSIILLVAASYAQNINQSFTIQQSNSYVTFPNSNRGTALTVVENAAGNPISPSSFTFVTYGCFYTSTCDTLDTYLGPPSATRTPSITKTYDYFKVSVSWIGGSGVSAVVDITVASATSNPGSGTVTSVSGTANQINSTGGATPVLSLSSTLVAPGTLSATTSIDATKLLGNLPALNGASLTSINASTLGGATFAAPTAIGGGTPSSGAFTTLNGTTYNTTTNCASVGTGADPSIVACSAASSGSFSCATNASAGTCTINTTAVTANSRIFVELSAAEGTNLSLTCNNLIDTGLTAPRLAGKVAATSFTINLGTFNTDPVCFNYWIVN